MENNDTDDIEEVLEQEETEDIEEHLVKQATVKDAGQFTEHHSYSPARPAPSMHSLITTTPGHLSKLKQPKLNYKPIQLPVKVDFQ